MNNNTGEEKIKCVHFFNGLILTLRFSNYFSFHFCMVPGPFQNFLELVPSLSGLVHAVVGGNYGTAMAALDGMQGQLMLDLHLKVRI